MPSGEPIVPIILSGGSGSRLWPLSTKETPKQLLALTGSETMLQATGRRTLAEGFADPIVVASGRHAGEIEAQLSAAGVQPRALILEPEPRNTAPAIALAALAAGAGATPLLVMPSDHLIDDFDAFRRAVAQASPVVSDEWMVAFGVTPTAPETGYGWIEVGEELSEGVHRASRFVEKPGLADAEAMLASGAYKWNAGIFMFRADTFLAALGTHAPSMLAACKEAMARSSEEGGRVNPDAEAFARSPANSIDYVVMENADQLAVVPVDMGWSDVGSFDALYAISELDQDGNARAGDVLAVDSRNCLVRSSKVRVSLLGVDDLIVVATEGEVLVMRRGRSQEVRKLADR